MTAVQSPTPSIGEGAGPAGRVLGTVDRVVHPIAFTLALLQLVLLLGLHPSACLAGRPALAAVSVLKLLVLAALFLQLRAVHARLARGDLSPGRAVFSWALGLVLTLVVLTPFREELAQEYRTPTTYLVSVEHEFGRSRLDGSPSDDQLRHRHFVAQWKRGEILLLESLLAIALAAAHVYAARTFGRFDPILSVFLAWALSVFLCAVFGYVFALVWLSYDLFYLGSMAGPLGFDLIAPWSLFPTTPLAAPFYLAASASTWLLYRARAFMA